MDENKGRLRYVEPTNLSNGAKNGTPSDFIQYPYEDYSMAVDLSIRMTNRYSCGLGDTNGEYEDLSYSSEKGTLSFLGGTKVGKNNSEQGFLTTNYTDIKMTKGDGYTSECLGIESIQIQYNSWMYPQVTIRFIDVRGATVMHPAEEGYYSKKDIGSSSSIYRALFSFPYPVFTLKVKGFYGKGVTYKLAVQKTNMEFDANSGSFVITATFIGYMYGIYADMPMSYIALAPFIDGGKQYWQNKIVDGTFRFRDSNGNEQCDMLTFPQLRERLAEAAANMQQVATSKANEYDNAIYLFTRLLESFPLDRYTWVKEKIAKSSRVNKENGDTIASFGLYCTTKDDFDAYKAEVQEYITLIKEAIQVGGNMAFTSDVIKYLSAINNSDDFKNGFNRNGLFEYEVTKSRKGELIVISATGTTDEKKNVENLIKANASILNQIGVGRKSYVWYFKYEINKNIIASWKKTISEKINTYTEKKTAEEERYKNETALAIEKALGFRPSIRNIYELIFAHMDTFMHCFYGRMRNIKNQLDGDKTKRQKSTFGVGDGDTDTEREFETNKDGSPSTTRSISAPSRAAYLPPWTAYYKEEYKNNHRTKVVRYPSELPNGETLEEVKFIADMLSAATLYNEENSEVSDSIQKIEDAVASGKDMTFTQGVSDNGYAPSSRVKHFIPLTPYDMLYKDSMQNPYSSMYDDFKSNNNSPALISNIIATFVLRAYYFICSQGERYGGATHASTYGNAISVDVTNNAKSFGDVEALNFYKAMENNTNSLFQDVISYYKDKPDELLALIESEGKYGYASAWQYGGESVNNSLFVEQSGVLVYNYHKTENKYYPTEFNSIKEIYSAYTIGGYDKDNRKFIKYGGVDTALTMDGLYDTVSASTFKMFEGSSYLSDLCTNVSEKISEMSSVFNATDSECSKIANTVTSDYKRLLNSVDTAVTFYGGVITDANEESMDKETISAVIYSGADDSAIYIKYPSQCSREGVTYYHHPIFGEALYKEQDNYGKAFLFLESLSKTPKTESGNQKIILNVDGVCSKIDLLRAGAYLWRAANMEGDNGTDPIKWDKLARAEVYTPKPNQTLHASSVGMRSSGPNTAMDIGTVHEGYATWEIESVSNSKDMKHALIRMFMEWAEDNGEYGFAGNVALLENKNLYTNCNFDEGLNISGLAALPETNLTLNKEAAQNLQEFLRNLFFTVYTTMDLYKKIAQKENFTCSPSMMSSAIRAFCSRLNQIYNTNAKEYTGIEFNSDTDKDSALQTTRDVKLSTYLALKSLYDKWLCGPPKGFDKTWTLQRERSDYIRTTNGSDFDNFIYVDSLYHDIGYDLTVNITKISEWLSSVLPTSNKGTTEGIVGDTNKSVYQFLTQIAQDCGGMLLALPCKFGMQSSENISEMFKPHSINSNWNEEQSSFIFMYTYKPSEHLGEPENHNIDMNGWSPEGDGYNLTDDDISGKLFGGDGRTVPAFGVTFAKQNQAFFTNIQLNTENAGVTEASLAAQFNIASKAGEGPRESSLYGQDLYRVYSQYSYKCGVEAMGNMQIMPLMYFQLNNIPLWKGAYMITKVSHAISAGEVKTNFEGVRVNRYAIPLADAAVITVKDTGSLGSRTSNYELNNYTCTIAQHKSMANIAKDTQYTNKAVSTVQDFDENKVTPKTPLICITPGHGPNTEKKAEWMAMSSLIDKYLVPELKQMKYPDGTSYNVQRCNKNGANALGNGYSMRETEYYVHKCGSDSVISISMHWNGGRGSRYEIYLNKNSVGWRADSKKLAQYLLDSINETAVKGRNGGFSLMPEGMMRQTNSINSLGEANSDGGPNQSCACVLLENWFADYSVDGTPWEGNRYNEKDENGRFKTGRAWLESEEGGKIISAAIIKGLKRYIDSISD